MKNIKLVKTIRTYEDLDLDQLNKYGLGLELQDFTEPNFTGEEREAIVDFYYEKLKGFKGIRAMHGPFLDLRPASPDGDIARLSREKYIQALDIASRLKLDYIVFHSQINPYHMEEYIRQLNARQNGAAWKEIMARTKDYKGLVVIENVFEKEPEILRELLDQIGLENVKVNLDIGHARLGDVDLETWLRTLGDYIVYSHIHTNDGEYDRHEAISREEVQEYLGLLEKYGLDPVLSLEYKIDSIKDELKKFS